MKVGYQAGVLQVLLDEAGLDFDHADGTSGGCLNLASSSPGLSGTRIADNWRNDRPVRADLAPAAVALPVAVAAAVDADLRPAHAPAAGLGRRLRADPRAARSRARTTSSTSPTSCSRRTPGRTLTPGPVQGLLRAADLVPGRRDRWQDLHRRRVLEGRQPDRGGRPRRGRDLGHLDRVRDARLPAWAVRPVLPHHRGDRRRPVLRGAAPRSRRSTPPSAPARTPSTARSGSMSSATPRRCRSTTCCSSRPAT